MSKDAGDFICNYTYYQNLRMFNETEVDSLFVHVPTFETISQEKQQAFVQDLLHELAEMY